MLLALFDLDNTLLAGDSDLLWGEMLAAHRSIDLERLRAFHGQYHAGTLDIDAFFEFQLEPLAREPLPRLLAWREQFVGEWILPRIARGARELVAAHRGRGHELVLITATNRFFVEPIAAEFGIPTVIATQPQMRDGRFTGAVEGVPCFRRGKVVHLAAWLAARGLQLDAVESWFYSDSHNDLPLFAEVDHPVAVDPDARLRAHALAAGWEIRSLGDQSVIRCQERFSG